MAADISVKRSNLLPVLSAVFLASCGSGLKDLKSDVSRLERSIADLRSIQAEQTTESAAVRNELRRVYGRLEEIEYRVGGGSRPAGREAEGFNQGLNQGFNQRVPLPSVVPEAILEQDESYAATLPMEVGRDFIEALKSIRSAEFTQALDILEGRLRVSRQEEWAAAVLFWIGVSYEGSGGLQQALSAYHELASTFPRHERSAPALFRQAALFRRLGDKEATELTLKKIIAQYPTSKEAGAAKHQLQNK